jgi:hypothetical protein
MPDAAITTRRPNISSRSTPLARNQVADAFAVPNLDRNRRHTPIQIQLKRTFFTGDSIALCEPRKSLRASRKDHLPFGEINNAQSHDGNSCPSSWYTALRGNTSVLRC